MREALPLEGVLTRLRLSVGLSLLGLVALGWVALVLMALSHHDHAAPAVEGSGWLYTLADLCLSAVEQAGRSLAMPVQGEPWGLSGGLIVLSMWAVMGVAMMLPTAAPMILTFADISATKLHDPSALRRRVAVFAGGYLVVWGGFAVFATLAQWGLHEAALLTPEAAVSGRWLGGGLLLLAGAYQFTPLKDLCLSQCRNPMTWFMGNWRNGARGAWRMGLIHGLWCLGCCWALMLVMFFAGVMNLAWMAGLAVLMLAEKVLPKGYLVGRGVGVVLILAGGFVLFQ